MCGGIDAACKTVAFEGGGGCWLSNFLVPGSIGVKNQRNFVRRVGERRCFPPRKESVLLERKFSMVVCLGAQSGIYSRDTRVYALGIPEYILSGYPDIYPSIT